MHNLNTFMSGAAYFLYSIFKMLFTFAIISLNKHFYFVIFSSFRQLISKNSNTYAFIRVHVFITFTFYWIFCCFCCSILLFLSIDTKQIQKSISILCVLLTCFCWFCFLNGQKIVLVFLSLLSVSFIFSLLTIF